ncbi:uncharacterized protein LOC111133481 [Crassostrea virginica]
MMGEPRKVVFLLLWMLSACKPCLSQAVNASSLSLDELVSGFRFQQLQLSTTMMNASFQARLPEKLAAAEAREADQREAKAFRAFHEAQTPFIATTSRYNLGYIGRGYDLFHGNPLSDDGVVDQGFRLPVMELPYSHRFTADGNYRIPDNVDVISESSARFGSSLHTVQSESDYKSMLSVDASVNAMGGGWGVSASFSASASYQKNTREIQKGTSSTLSIVSRAVVYRARMSETAKVSKVNDFFEKAVMLLPMENCDSSELQEMYLNFIQEFGTHYTTEVVMGAKAVQQLTFSKSDLSKLESEGISSKVAAQASFSGFGASAGGGFSVGVGSKEEAFNRVQNTSKEQYEYYIGGNPPSGDFKDGGTESLREWARSADEKPVPIQYKLTSIDTLLKPGYFKDITYGLFERRRCMRQALYTHCKQTVSPSQCNPPDFSVNLRSRRKRQTEEAPVDGIKFGDFISLENRGSRTFLALSDSTGYLAGAVTKPLVTVNSFSNYAGLFQIRSNDDDDTTVAGTPLSYGQVFRLVTVQGDNLFTGRAFIDDMRGASEDKLMAVFDGKDDRKFSAPDDLTGFSIFLKMDRDRPYMISLQIACNILMKPRDFQVNVEGDKGTVKFEMRIYCSYGTKWFHKAFSDSAIGEIERVAFMSAEGTYPIKGIQIRTSKDRKILRYRNESLSCTGNEIKFSMNNKESKPADVDIYPARFSLHSKNHPLGSPVTRRDTVFVEVVSAVPKQLYWGQPSTHLLSHRNNMVTIEVKQPGTHQQKSVASACNGIIFPDNGRLGVISQLESRSFVSFAVEVMIKKAVINTEIKFPAASYKVEYISRNSSDFQKLTNMIRSPSSGSTSDMTITFPDMYLSAVQIYVDGSTFAEKVKSILITGCPAALVEKKTEDTQPEEWSLSLSENMIQTYPYLKVVPTQYNVSTFDRIFEDLERPYPAQSYRIDIQLEKDKRGCMIDDDYIQNYLMTTDEIEGLKFENTRVSSSLNSITVTTSVSAMNKILYQQNIPALSGVLRMAVQQYPCNADRTSTFAFQVSSEEALGLSVGAKAGISILAVVVVVCIVVIAIIVLRFRRIKREPLQSESCFALERNIHVNEDSNMEAHYTNNAFDDQGGNLSTASPALPSRQRRLT